MNLNESRCFLQLFRTSVAAFRFGQALWCYGNCLSDVAAGDHLQFSKWLFFFWFEFAPTSFDRFDSL